MMITIHQRNQKVSNNNDSLNKSSQNTLPVSLSSTRQIYHWLAHNSVNIKFAYWLLLFLPSMNVPLFEKLIVLFSLTSDKQFTNEQISNVKILLYPKFHIQYVPIYCWIWSQYMQQSSLFCQQSLGMIQTHVTILLKFPSLLDDKIRSTVQLITCTVLQTCLSLFTIYLQNCSFCQKCPFLLRDWAFDFFIEDHDLSKIQ